MGLIDLSARELLAAFRSPEPTPGGGSAAALAGAVGASLLAMVSGISRPRASGEDDLRKLQQAGEACTALAETLARLVDRDSEAYNGVVAAFKLPKTTEAEKQTRTTAIQHAMRRAAEVPLEVMRACRTALEQAEVIARLGNPNASSDVGVAAALLNAALHGARLNVEINLESIRDETFVTGAREQIERLSTGG